MRIRQGFVSNSSSSSFVIIIAKDKFEKLLDKLDDYQKAVLEKMEKANEKIFGVEAVVINGVTGNYSSFEYIVLDECDDISPQDFYDKFGYEKYPEDAFFKIEWPEGTFQTEFSF